MTHKWVVFSSKSAVAAMESNSISVLLSRHMKGCCRYAGLALWLRCGEPPTSSALGAISQRLLLSNGKGQGSKLFTVEIFRNSRGYSWRAKQALLIALLKIIIR